MEMLNLMLACSFKANQMLMFQFCLPHQSSLNDCIVNFKKRGPETAMMITENNRLFPVILHLDGLHRYVNIFQISFFLCLSMIAFNSHA